MQSIPEDEIKGLEAEIDSAIDRLFVDKNRDTAEVLWNESGMPDDSHPREPTFPRGLELPEDQDFSFPAGLELSAATDGSLSLGSEPSKEKETILAFDSGASDDSAFFLSDPPKAPQERQHLPRALGKPPADLETLFSHASNSSHPKSNSFSPDSQLPHERESFFAHPAQPSHEKKSGPPSTFEASYKMEKGEPSSPESSPRLKLLDRMETHLLSLEWEITQENLGNSREAAAALREASKGNPDVIRVLDLMEKVLHGMIQKEKDIRPPMVKFLLDAKETVRLLLREENYGEIQLYKQLAYEGIETRFFCLNSGAKGEESSRTEEPDVWNRLQGVLSRISALEERMEGVLKEWEIHLTRFQNQRPEAKGRLCNVTVFRVNQSLLGVESDKVFKLFKISNGLDKRYVNQQKVRLKDFETRIIDLKEILAIEGKGENQETKILVVKENGEYKGLMVDQVIKSLTGCEEIDWKQDPYFSGAIVWTYQDRPVKIPILDLNKMSES